MDIADQQIKFLKQSDKNTQVFQTWESTKNIQRTGCIGLNENLWKFRINKRFFTDIGQKIASI